MGWKSTIGITRKTALRRINLNLEDCSDKNLADILESVMGGDSHCHNYRIVATEEDAEEYNAR